MDKIILGLLLMAPMTSYELRAHIKEKFSMMCSDSAGSIQVAIKKLIAENLIEFTEYVENGKNKKQYKITVGGQQVFNSWVGEPMQHHKAKNMELTKLFFMGEVESAKRAPLVKAYLSSLRSDWQALIAMQKEIIASIGTSAINNGLPDTVQFQITTLEYGIALFEFEIKWYEGLLNRIEGGTHP